MNCPIAYALQFVLLIIKRTLALGVSDPVQVLLVSNDATLGWAAVRGL